MFEAAIAWAKCDQTRIFGIGERDARLGDAFEPGGRRVTLEYGGGIDDGEISPARKQDCLALAGAQDERGGEKRGKLRPSDRGGGNAVGGKRPGGGNRGPPAAGSHAGGGGGGKRPRSICS